MNATMGWLLAATALVAGWFSYGWAGVALAITVTVFWLLLQFSRAVRVMREAGKRPVGRVGSVVMLQSRLKPGMSLLDVIGKTHSLGEKQGEGDDVWRWQDDGDVSLTLHFTAGKLQRWEMARPDGEPAAGTALQPAATPPAP